MSKTASKEEALAYLNSVGIDPVQLAVESGLAIRKARARLEVVVNDEDRAKFGAVTIYKIRANGFKKPMMGVFADDVPVLIEGLQNASAILNPEGEEA